VLSGSSGSNASLALRRSSRLGGAPSSFRSRRTVPPYTARSRGRTGLGVPPRTTGRIASSRCWTHPGCSSESCRHSGCVSRGTSPWCSRACGPSGATSPPRTSSPGCGSPPQPGTPSPSSGPSTQVKTRSSPGSTESPAGLVVVFVLANTTITPGRRCGVDGVATDSVGTAWWRAIGTHPLFSSG
jgi:hypothetical protein